MFCYLKQAARMSAVAAALFIGTSAQSPSQAQEDTAEGFMQLDVEPGKVMVLATWHFSNPGQDTFNADVDDVLAPKRQAEIQRLVEALAEFQPTHVAIEGTWGLEVYETRYNAYLTGEAELTRNERQQIGFRLAKMLGHEQVWPVDYELDMGANIEGNAWARLGEYPELWGKAQAMGQHAVGLIGEMTKTRTVPGAMRFMNSPEVVAANHAFYTDYLMMMGGDDHIPGPKMIANWYERNLMITHNLLRLYEGPETRILAIYGQGHAYLMTQFLKESSYYDVVDPLAYIPED